MVGEPYRAVVHRCGVEFTHAFVELVIRRSPGVYVEGERVTALPQSVFLVRGDKAVDLLDQLFEMLMGEGGVESLERGDNRQHVIE